MVFEKFILDGNSFYKISVRGFFFGAFQNDCYVSAITKSVDHLFWVTKLCDQSRYNAWIY